MLGLIVAVVIVLIVALWSAVEVAQEKTEHDRRNR